MWATIVYLEYNPICIQEIKREGRDRKKITCLKRNLHFESYYITDLQLISILAQ